MSNIFENAKFGDKFVTREGKMAIYVAKHEDRGYYSGVSTEISHTYALENRCTVHWCNDNGINLSFIEDFDIVGRWKEPIDEDCLETLVACYEKENGYYEYCSEDIEEAYKAGYRKAKEE